MIEKVAAPGKTASSPRARPEQVWRMDQAEWGLPDSMRLVLLRRIPG
jgi:hypothetical protein